MLIPTGTSVGLTSVSLGVIRAMERKGVRLSVFKPIAQPRSGGDAPDQTTTIVRASSSTTTAAEPLKMSHVESLLSSNQKDVLMEEIIANYHANTQDAEVVLVDNTLLKAVSGSRSGATVHEHKRRLKDGRVITVRSYQRKK